MVLSPLGCSRQNVFTEGFSLDNHQQFTGMLDKIVFDILFFMIYFQACHAFILIGQYERQGIRGDRHRDEMQQRAASLSQSQAAAVRTMPRL